jgi:hypothetical protein
MSMTTPSVAVGIAPESECRRSQQEPLVVRLSAQHSNRKRLACATDARNGIDKIRVRVLDRGMCAVPDRAVTRRVRGNRGVPNGCACGPNRLSVRVDHFDRHIQSEHSLRASVGPRTVRAHCGIHP